MRARSQREFQKSNKTQLVTEGKIAQRSYEGTWFQVSKIKKITMQQVCLDETILFRKMGMG